jgi:hypothetical protein
MAIVSAVSPWRTALQREACSPGSVRGRRLTSIAVRTHEEPACTSGSLVLRSADPLCAAMDVSPVKAP